MPQLSFWDSIADLPHTRSVKVTFPWPIAYPRPLCLVYIWPIVGSYVLWPGVTLRKVHGDKVPLHSHEADIPKSDPDACRGSGKPLSPINNASDMHHMFSRGGSKTDSNTPMTHSTLHRLAHHRHALGFSPHVGLPTNLCGCRDQLPSSLTEF